MVSNAFENRMETVRGYLFLALGFMIPLSAAAISILSVLIVILWVLDRNYAQKIEMHSENPVYIAIFAFFILHLVGLLWSEEPINPMKSWLLFIAPLLATAVSREYARRGVYAFVTGMMVSEIYVYFKIFEHWDAWLGGGVIDVFLGPDHISYNPMLAMATAVILTTLLAGAYRGWKKYITIFFLLTMTANMFMTGGRAGHVGFIFIWVALSIYFLYRKPVALGAMIASLILVVITAYNFSPIFKARANLAVSESANYEQAPNTSVGKRLVYSEHSFKLFLEHPWVGHGTGGFESAYKAYWERGGIPADATANPHSNHALILVQFGLLGLFFYGAIFVAQLALTRKMPNDYEFKAIAFVLPLFFILISFYDSYLWGHHTQAMFAFFASIIYRQDLFSARGSSLKAV